MKDKYIYIYYNIILYIYIILYIIYYTYIYRILIKGQLLARSGLALASVQPFVAAHALKLNLPGIGF